MSKEELALRTVFRRRSQEGWQAKVAQWRKTAKKREDDERERAANETLWQAHRIACRARIFVSLRENAVIAALSEEDAENLGCTHFALEDQNPNRPLDSRSFRALLDKIMPLLPQPNAGVAS